MNKIILWPILFLSLGLSACSPGKGKGGGEATFGTNGDSKPSPTDAAPSTPQQTVAESTYSPSKAMVIKEGDYDVVYGATRASGLKAGYDAAAKVLSLQADLKLSPLDEGAALNLQLNVLGKADDKGFIIMHASKSQPSLPADVKVGVKATCLGEGFSCQSSFIDIYVQYRGKIYHHQVKTFNQEAKSADKADKTDKTNKTDKAGDKPAEKPAEKNAPKATEQNQQAGPSEKQQTETKPTEAKPSEPKSKPQKSDKPAAPAVVEYEKNEGVSDVAKGEHFVGDTLEDIRLLFDEGKASPSAGKETIKKIIQVIGSVNDGRLENAVNLMDYENKHKPAGFHVIQPERKRYFGSSEMLYMIANMGKYSLQIAPKTHLAVSDISTEHGGNTGHASHQNGLDADVAYYFDDPKLQDKLSSVLDETGAPVKSWMIEKQWQLLKFAVSLKFVDRIFVHENVKKALCQFAIKKGELNRTQQEGLAYETLRRLRPENEHYNHFHLRVKCSKAQGRCGVPMAEVPAGSGCF